MVNDPHILALHARLARGEVAPASVSDAELLAVGEVLRDHFLAQLDGRLNDEDARLLQDAMARIEPREHLRVQSLPVSFHPSTRFSNLRFIHEDHLDPAWRARFARPSAEAPEMAAAFVDPIAFHFLTYENILPLDRLFESVRPKLALRDRKKHRGHNLYTFLLETNPGTRAQLERLDALDLYVRPLNAGSRGGQRMIFHASGLAEALTAAVKVAMPTKRMKGFSHVNPVFRLNRFAPDDAPFDSHYDAPYFDASRDHISRYTMLIYLTGGQAQPTLRIAEARLMRLLKWQCVVFDQRYEHEGFAYEEGDKIFLRTELIFESRKRARDPQIAALFSTACYMTGESIREPALGPYTHDCFDRVAAAHWEGLEEPPEDAEIPFVHKNFREVHWISNGFDFWFPSASLSLEECAALVVLDYFNCEVEYGPFRGLCDTEVIEGRRDSAWIPEHLAQYSDKKNHSPFHITEHPEPLFADLDRRMFFPPAEAPDADLCCPECDAAEFDPTRSAKVIDEYLLQIENAREALRTAPILIMGMELFLDPERFVIEGDKIYLLSEKMLAPIHFAAVQFSQCWTRQSPTDFIEQRWHNTALIPLMPPILFTEVGGCYHLMLDFFRNDWMVDLEANEVSLPELVTRGY